MLLQDIKYSSLRYTVGPHCLSVLYIVVCISNPKLITHPSPTPHVPFGNHKFVFPICESVSVLQISSKIRFHM